ncbi:hypothetical protein SISSUDRAFT_45063 [Sistotremastrum suecicum HHB10207 ss-3]|uniref:histone acetyltransferase n=1 Tax=Sistotremastrum suecicum HHB10207 ss-3 TaxID=1314776 RepID=A0A166H838_9AGAM|nr:hypothetical protein SISSUDRAFT_45063 [Sistotremastrum suecicum HHB10207 ss-3]
MAPSAHSNKDDLNLPPPKVSPGGSYDIEDVQAGCKLYVLRPGPNGMEERLAEILSRRDHHTAMNGMAVDSQPGSQYEYFVHWENFNKRLDEWISGARLLLSREMEWPRPKPPPGKGSQGKVPQKTQVSKAPKARKGTGGSATPAMPVQELKPPTFKLTQDDEDEDAEGEMDMSVDLEEPGSTRDSREPTPFFSKKQEIEKLRTSGSMTQSISEIARVKNLNRLQIGKHEVEAWYFSPYPKEYAHLPILYICEFCLSFYPSSFMLLRHRSKCNLLHPPGNEIYRDDDISFFEVDGRRQLTWCRNLSLISKCFLDHKTLYYDVQPFMYYIMTQRDSHGCHIIGYFSKEKESSENYNVACILTLPQHQRHGYGKLLIEFSYELSKKEGKLGSPEKPLSDLGLLGYRAYWAETILELLKNEEELSIDEIAQKTSITHADIMNTCTTLQLIKHFKGAHVICLTESVLEQHEKSIAKRKRKIKPENLQWRPPVFTREQLRFGY